MYNKLLGIMREQGKTQRQTAEAIGIGLPALNEKLNGKRQFTRDNILKLCNYLGIESKDIGDIFFKT